MTTHHRTDGPQQSPAQAGALESRRRTPATRQALLLAALAAPVALALAVAGTAAASPIARAAVGHAASTTSPNFAGYELTSGPATSASATFTIPALTCPKSGALGILPGASLGPDDTAAYTVVRCSNGVPVYRAGASLNGTEHRFSMRPKPGDRMTASVTETAAASVAKITDLTQRTSVTVRSGGGTEDTVTIGDVGLLGEGAKLLGVPPFGTITFRSASVNGNPLGASSPLAVNRTTVLGTLQIRTGPLNGAGTSFTTAFKHA